MFPFKIFDLDDTEKSRAYYNYTELTIYYHYATYYSLSEYQRVLQNKLNIFVTYTPLKDSWHLQTYCKSNNELKSSDFTFKF